MFLSPSKKHFILILRIHRNPLPGEHARAHFNTAFEGLGDFGWPLLARKIPQYQQKYIRFLWPVVRCKPSQVENRWQRCIL